MTLREENLKKINDALETFFEEHGYSVPSKEIVLQINDKFASFSDEKLDKAASPKMLLKFKYNLGEIFTAANFNKTKLTESELAQITGGGDSENIFKFVGTVAATIAICIFISL